MFYKHTQIGYLMIFVFLALALYFGFILTVIGLYSPFVVILSLVLFLVASFVSLKVMIDGTHLRIKFGYGIFSKRFVLRDIISAKTVKNHWYYGWGIRYWPWSHMWIFNISGFDAVEIKMKNGKTYRIGTDEPEKLEHSIMQVIKR
jgi:hypothetical protein